MKSTRFVGLDVHAATIAVAVAEPDGEVRAVGTIPNEPEAVRRLVKKLGPAEHLRACYEAGPCGYVLYWQLTALGVACDVIAPTLVPVKAGDRVKTDRRDAERLARSLRSGDLTAVWVPDAAHEALRDLVRAREAAKKDQLRARHRLQKFLLEAVPGAQLVLLRGLARTDEISQRFVRGVGHPDRRQIAAAKAAGQALRVAAVRLDAVARLHRHQRGRDDVAGHAERGELPVQHVAAWP